MAVKDDKTGRFVAQAFSPSRRSDRLKRKDESVMEGAARVAIDAVYEARNANRSMHEAGKLAAERAMRLALTDLHAMLYPEKYPGYDPDHVYWASGGEGEGVFEWDSGTIEWVSEWLDRQMWDSEEEG